LGQSLLIESDTEVNIVYIVLKDTFLNINNTLPNLLSLSDGSLKLIKIYINCSLYALQQTIDSLINLITIAQNSAIRIVCTLIQILLNIIDIKINLLLQLISNLEQALSNAISIGSLLTPYIQYELNIAYNQLEGALRQGIYYGIRLLFCVENLSQQLIDQVVSYILPLQSILTNILVSNIQTSVNNAITNGTIGYLSPNEYNSLESASEELVGVLQSQINVAQNPSQPIQATITPQLTTVRAQLQQTYNQLTSQLNPQTPNPPAFLSISWKKILHWIRIGIDLLDNAVNGI
jgi:hypothetical protein